jgi:hypothetical protein
LVEFKFSAVPTWTGNQLALATYPSVAFWNPYNLPIELNEVFIDVPMNLEAQAYNSKEWDLLRKWYLHNPNSSASYIPHNVTTSNSVMPAQNWQAPNGALPYIDTNGNGRWDPGEPRTWIPRPPRRPGRGGGINNQIRFNYNRATMFHPSQL